MRLRLAIPGEGARVNAALAALSADMGDRHRASDALIETALFGPDVALYALLAEEGPALHGVAIFSPQVSTYRGAVGAYVSDIWVDAAARGQGLGARLLAGVRDEAARRWGPGFLRLAVYDDNARARAFYDRLGFHPKPDEIWLTLEGAALEAL